MLIEAIKDDPLRKYEKEEKRKAEKTILNAAKLIAPVIESSFASGFDWSVRLIKLFYDIIIIIIVSGVLKLSKIHNMQIWQVN